MTVAMLLPILLTVLHLCRGSELDLDQAYASASLTLFRASAPDSSSFVFSPLSLTAGLAVLHEGADEITKKELQNLLLPGSSSEGLTKFYSEMLMTVLSESSEPRLLMATGLFVKDNYKLNQKFIDQSEKVYNVGLESINFTDAVRSAKKINDFIATNTRDMIKDVLKGDEIRNTVFVLVNALSFTAPWVLAFNPKNGEKRTFHGINGKRENVEFMGAEHRAFSYHEIDSAEVLTIPFQWSEGSGQHYYFVILLPKPDQDFKEFKKNLSSETFHGLLTTVEDGNQKVKVLIPKINIESKMPAREALKKMGLKAIFSAGNLMKISNDPSLFVSDIKHEAVLKIHEYGADAAAMTFFSLAGSSRLRKPEDPIPFIADRPFLFALVDERKHPMFLGQFV